MSDRKIEYYERILPISKQKYSKELLSLIDDSLSYIAQLSVRETDKLTIKPKTKFRPVAK